MKNKFNTDIMVIFCITLVLFIVSTFLPDTIAIHYNSKGEADMFSNKYIILLGIPIIYSGYWTLFRKKKN